MLWSEVIKVDISDHVKLAEARVAAVNVQIATARALGDVARLTDLERELIEAEQTLARLRAA